MIKKPRKRFIILSVIFIVMVTIILIKTVNAAGKIIIIGDSRTRNMSRWVNTSAETRFVAKSGQGYEWFIKEGAVEATGLAEKGDTIIIWLGVNDYDVSRLYDKYGKTPWELYTEEINKLAKTEWRDLNVCVAAVGYIDRSRMISFYDFDIKSNVYPINQDIPIKGIKGFNDYVKKHLDSSITWIDPNHVIGIKSSDDVHTKARIWVKRGNGSYDGLHYSKSTTQKVYNYFVRKAKEISRDN